MKNIALKVLSIAFFMGIVSGSKCQNKYYFVLEKYSPEVSFITMDSSWYVQSTVVEYKDYLVLIELPFVDYGADKSTNLYEDTLKAVSFINFLSVHFNNKPVKYVLHTHWHLHSLSGITPFLKRGATLVTTQKNWDYSVSNGLLGAYKPMEFERQIIRITKDSSILSKTKFPIDIIYLDSTYKNKPTKDYLFFYFPKLKTLHASCMAAINEVDFSTKKDYLYSDRLTDLDRAVTSRNLQVDTIIKLERFKNLNATSINHTFTYSYFKQHIKNGKSLNEVITGYTTLPNEVLIEKKDSILANAINKKLNPEVFNSAVYECIRHSEYRKAILLAQLLNLYSPGELNYIDTMGEAYYTSGDTSTASYYDSILMKRDAKFGGGIKSWEQNKKNNAY